MRYSSSIAGIALALSLLASCAAVNPLSAAKLSALSPLDADPAGLRVALRLPAPLELGKGNAHLTMSWSSSSMAPIKQEYKLDVTDAQAASMGPAVALRQGEKFVVLSVADTDVEALRAFQDRVRAEKKAGRDGKGSLSVGFSGGCWRGAFPAGVSRLPLEIWLQTAPTEDYLPLVQGADLLQVLARAGASTIESCR